MYLGLPIFEMNLLKVFVFTLISLMLFLRHEPKTASYISFSHVSNWLDRIELLLCMVRTNYTFLSVILWVALQYAGHVGVSEKPPAFIFMPRHLFSKHFTINAVRTLGTARHERSWVKTPCADCRNMLQRPMVRHATLRTQSVGPTANVIVLQEVSSTFLSRTPQPKVIALHFLTAHVL
jgi:hypothetical protein